jgi:hypothetical protein
MPLHLDTKEFGILCGNSNETNTASIECTSCDECLAIYKFINSKMDKWLILNNVNPHTLTKELK